MNPDSKIAKSFIQSVNQGNAEAVDQLLVQNSELRAAIDQPWFGFDSPAIVAVKKNRALVEVLMRHGADIDVRSKWWAGSFGVLDGVDADTAAFLLEKGATLDIHSAAEQGRAEDVQHFLDQDASSVNKRGGDGVTPMHVAKTSTVIELLLDHGADLTVRCLDHSSTAAQYAVDDSEKCRTLMEAGATPDIFMAAMLNDAKLVEKVLQSQTDAIATRIGSCPHTKPIHQNASRHIYFWKLNNAETVFEVAKDNDHQKLYTSLFEKASDKDRFIAACWDGDSEVLKSVLQTSPNVFSELNDHEQNDMCRAAWQGRFETVKLMIESGFDPHRAGPENSTPIDRAAFHGFHEIVQLLIDRDSSPPFEFKNEFGGTPLSCCIWGSVHSWMKNDSRSDHAACVEAMIAAGSPFDASWIPTVNPKMDAILKTHLPRSPKT